jgi:6-pyruvoyltetrahydropterin/6-carboxytetrahydropterin synthase
MTAILVTVKACALVTLLNSTQDLMTVNNIRRNFAMHQVTKRFGHELGLSCAFRQWRATDSHCSKLHGYALSITLTFEAEKLDARNWVMDFGNFKYIRKCIEEVFDHKTLIAADDPKLPWFQMSADLGVLDLVVLPNVGCEMFAQHVYGLVKAWMSLENKDRVHLVSVTVAEHGANSATYIGERNEVTKTKGITTQGAAGEVINTGNQINVRNKQLHQDVHHVEPSQAYGLHD